MSPEGEDHNPPSESQRTSGTLQDNQQSRREQAEQVDQQSRKLFNEIRGRPTRLTFTGYQIILNPKRYFKLGRVFMTLWAEPKGSHPSSDEGVQVESDHAKTVFREIRHFVVVRAKAGHCLCVPISTYGGQGTLKHTTQPAQDHAVIVVFGDEPQLQPGERELTKQPLKVICEDPTLQKLHPASRINFGKVYTIEYNIRVRTFGRIATESLPLLQKYFVDTIVGTRDADEDTLRLSEKVMAANRRTLGESLSAPMDKLNVSTTEADSSWGYGPGGNNTRPPPATRHSTTGRKATLSSVDDDSPPNLLTSNQPQGGAPSIAEGKFDMRGTDGDREALDHRYHLRPDAAKFFTIGRVFAMLWQEDKESFEPVIAGRFQERIFSRIRRLAVVKADHGFCLCIPINTYGGQGVLIKGLNRRDREAHAIIHMDNTNPGSTSEEKRLMVKEPIAVHPAAPNQKLDIMSRLNFAKICIVEWNVKVMNVGEVTKDSMPLFTRYWRSQLEQ
jgi:hypothetical protein